MDAREFDAWLASMGRAWEERDPDHAAELFAEDALYYETPFSEPLRGRDAIRGYLAEVPEAQENVSFRYDVVAVAGEVGMARWWTSLDRVPSGVHAEFDGVFVLTFNASGRCSEFREWCTGSKLAPRRNSNAA